MPRRQQSLQQVELGQQVVAERCPWVLQALARGRLSSEVIDRFGLGLAYHVLDGAAVAHVGPVQSDTARQPGQIGRQPQSADLVTLLLQMAEEVSSNEATDARDQGLHAWMAWP